MYNLTKELVKEQIKTLGFNIVLTIDDDNNTLEEWRLDTDSFRIEMNMFNRVALHREPIQEGNRPIMVEINTIEQLMHLIEWCK